ncbi:ribosome small subunit-dependent GTPase A [Novisyntrophococcus fermenticellae]|uniref:ribosome small subunit-dependent GTPase A n=1 Tax=Novisyntrophococcus fermenticellae TaxID=2068655 RepID=UPI001E5BC995|nr:ribosome small subunit-dependent GTPase A [Novisyntrophococcus fermenticellae]
MNYLEKYGITDRFKNEAAAYPKLSLARVAAQHRGLYKIVTESGELQAEISGKLRFETNELAKFPTVGDYVMISSENSGSNAIIHHVLTRKSIFLRTAVGVSGQAQPVAANIDIVFICMSLNNNFNLSRLERYLSVAWDSGATPVILLTKSDLCEDLERVLLEVERVSSFTEVIPLSMFDDDLVTKLSLYLKSGMTAAFIGSSGVGKSTLINKLLGEQELATSEVGKGDKGRHTTTGREMFLSPFGVVLIDTPGMRELGAESVDLSKSFEDIETLAGQCKFNNCTHTNEPGCAILQALDDGSLDQRRFSSYLKLRIEAGYDGLSAKEIENKKLERMLKDVGGMKNFRKYVKEKRKQR